MRLRFSIYLWVVLLLSFAGCSKKTISVEPTYDDAPVPITVGFMAESDVDSKAVVDSWQGDVVNLFGMRREKDGGYDFENELNIVDYEAEVSGANSTSVEVYSDRSKGFPYYYQEEYIYDFFAYHSGDALISQKHFDYDACYLDVELTGSDDLMYAYTDRYKDVTASDDGALAMDLLYSAHAARRGVQPTLIFKHALSRFIFIADGEGTKYDKLEILGLEVTSPNKGRLVFSGADPGFEVDEDALPVAISLKGADDKALPVQDVVDNESSVPLGGDGASIMLPPGSDVLPVLLKLRIKDTKTVVDYGFEVKAEEIKTEGPRMETFQPGLYYKVFMTIYGPEEIKIVSTLDGWDEGGDFEIDPDKESGQTVPDDMGTGGVNVGDYDEGGNLGDIYD